MKVGKNYLRIIFFFSFAPYGINYKPRPVNPLTAYENSLISTPSSALYNITDNNVPYCGCKKFKVRRAGIMRLCRLLTTLRTLRVIISSLNTIKTAHIQAWPSSSLY